MQKFKKIPNGFVLRNAFEKEMRGKKSWCAICGKPGVVGQDLSTVYTETDMPVGRTYSVWAICEECEKKYPETNVR